jgi:tetratricopeptide (TPR) repeat protein
MGSYLQNRSQLELAARSFRVAMEHGQINLETWHLADIDEMAASCLSLTLQLQKKDDEAVQVLETVLSGDNRSPRLCRQLLNLYAKHAREQEALALVERLPMGREQQGPMREAVRGAVRSAKQDWTAALGYLQSAYVAGCHDPFCLRWLAVTLLSNGEIAAALPVLQHWRQVEPGNAELAMYLKAIADRMQAAAKEEAPTEPARQVRFDVPASMANFNLPTSHSAPQATPSSEQGKPRS